MPVIVDAAAQLPPRSNLTDLPAMGCDLSVFSGGKGLFGPQSSGLILGRKDLIAACHLNSNPHSAIGRGMKVGKEEVMGLLTAVEVFLAKDEKEEYAEWRAQMEHIAQAAEAIDGVQAEVVDAKQHPSVQITLDDSVGKTAEQVNSELRAGTPSIVNGGGNDTVVFNPMTLLPGEEKTIAERLVEVLA